MKLSKDIFNEEQLSAIKEADIGLDFHKDYSDDELLAFEEKFENLVMDNQFNNVGFYEHMLDAFQDATND